MQSFLHRKLCIEADDKLSIGITGRPQGEEFSLEITQGKAAVRRRLWAMGSELEGNDILYLFWFYLEMSPFHGQSWETRDFYMIHPYLLKY